MRNILTCIVFAIIICVEVKYFTFDHPYLLADNRHYTFYIWKNWFQRHWIMKYLLVPGYIYAFWAVNSSLRHKTEIWRLGFFLCTALVTVPNRLLEFRYFLIPFLIWRLNLDPKRQTFHLLVIELFLYVVVNIFTVYMFLYKPFVWNHEPGIQRFMW